MGWATRQFVASGSLSVAAEYVHKPILVKGSVGMNIVSAMFAATGITLLIVELVGNKVYGYSTSLDLLKADNGIAGMMLFISLLEFSIAILLSHHKSHATHHLPQPALPFASHAVSSNPAGLPIISSAPPAYCNDGYAP
ncbi:membrane-spanning 4-domains subfamily A member 12-like [Apteryx mantelli]|uniref:Membrane-spanning 4-domains subfamily A member 12-like n=1 Tax=Apteryx mantelli TaxID=2696672 RepID=A0ABM4EF64_9AVES